MDASFFLSLLIGVAFVGLAMATDERRRQAPSLPLSPSPPLEVSALLPVRDEEEHIAGCLAGILGQEPPLARLRVVDDGSTDRTAERVTALASGHPELELVPAGPLPAGWRGKLNALAVGTHGLSSPFLLTTDADVRLAPRAVARALAAAEAGDLALVSLAGLQEARGLGENLLVPSVFGLLDALLGDWRQAALGGGAAVANGQFLLLRRQAWEACGGFAAVRTAPMDDVAIAALLRERGFRTAFFSAPELLAVRMYRGLDEAWHGWRRNLPALLGSAGRAARLGAAVALPPLALLAALAAGRWLEAALLWTSGAAASMILRTGSRHAPAYGLLYPADALLLAAALLLGALDRKRGKLRSWKGREMPVELP